MPETFTQFLFPEYRLDWFGAGPSSPNKTGALLALIFLVAWWPALRFRWGYWLSLPLAFVAAGLMLQTESRGALVGAVAGSVLLLSACPFFVHPFSVAGKRRSDEPQLSVLQWLGGFGLLAGAAGTTPSFAKATAGTTPPSGHPSLGRRGVWVGVRIGVGLVAIMVLVVYSQWLGMTDRVAAMASGADGSSNVRVALYSAGVAMLADAPGGWGAGEAGNAYGQWYQAVGDGRSYLSLVNSHLTWMADRGLAFRALYISWWCVALLICLPLPWTPLRAVSFAVWVALGVCGFFSSVLTLGWLWVLPALLLALCVGQRIRERAGPSRRQGVAAAIAALLAFAGIHGVGYALSGEPGIRADREWVRIGENPGAIRIVAPDRRILGDKYGHTIREDLERIGGVTVVREAERLADGGYAGCEMLVFSGAVPAVDLDGFDGRVVLLNPGLDGREALEQRLAAKDVRVVVGALGDWRRARIWRAAVEARPNWEFVELRGVADFVPGWPKYLEPFLLRQGYGGQAMDPAEAGLGSANERE